MTTYNTHDNFKKSEENDQEYVQEEVCLVTDTGKYLQIDWFIEDEHPEEPVFMTEFGPCPKAYTVIDGIMYINSDMSIISKS